MLILDVVSAEFIHHSFIRSLPTIRQDKTRLMTIEEGSRGDNAKHYRRQRSMR